MSETRTPEELMNEVNLFLRKGATVCCPECNKSYMQAARDIYVGERLSADQWEVREEYKDLVDPPENGERLMCKLCGSIFQMVWKTIPGQYSEATFYRKLNVVRNHPLADWYAEHRNVIDFCEQQKRKMKKTH